MLGLHGNHSNRVVDMLLVDISTLQDAMVLCMALGCALGLLLRLLQVDTAFASRALLTPAHMQAMTMSAGSVRCSVLLCC
jgi:hypothetical protein